MMIELELPKKIGGEAPDKLKLAAGAAVLFFGPNGAGKTRFAGYLDKTYSHRAILISAHRNLMMPKTYAVMDPDEQFEQIFGKAGFGSTRRDPDYSKNHRYSKDPNAFASNDFQNVLNILAARHIDGLNAFKKNSTNASVRQTPESTVFELAIDIWAQCLPDLEIDIDEAPKMTIRRKSNRSKVYDPAEMSDGERGLFYLVAKSLIAPPDSIILVDEPEMYLHRAIRNVTWDLIEKSRPDCVFAYFTHDIDFSITRIFSSKVGIYRHEPSTTADRTQGLWEYGVLESADEIPEDLLITVLGSRTNTLLVEGEKDSWDSVIARIRYPDFLIEPMGGCEQVIKSVKALNNYTKFHATKAYGLIDVDFRSADEIAKLQASDVHTHSFREIENVLASEEVITALLHNLGRADAVQPTIHSISVDVTARIRADINRFQNKLCERTALEKFRTSLRRGADLVDCAMFLEPGVIQLDAKSKINTLLASNSLNELLKIFSIRKDNYKQQLAQKLKLKNWQNVEDTLMRWIKDERSPEHQRLISALQKHFPKI